VFPDVETMTADAPLCRHEDADCCPSGGKAHVELAIEKGRFVVKSATTGPAKAAAPPRATD
jgi:hypothetical protein